MAKERTKFDESKDVTLGSWQYGSLTVSVKAYDGGQPKLQLGPRTFKDEETGEEKFKKCGRLGAKEVSWLINTVMKEAGEYLGLEPGEGDNVPF